ncbi:MAG: DUF6265 family protein [Acidobacteria bacterium]|nr:DUF6265 family protein [Acidobacteriota bacterium]MCA1627464.1 DUF6265 family protein [Acidobacteriota bacterium]
MRQGRAQVEEHWTSVAGGSMMGMSRTVAGEKTVVRKLRNANDTNL